LRQSEAWEFVRFLKEPTDRLLVELALAKALSFLVSESDSDYRDRFKEAPLDLFTFARAVHSFLC